MTAIKQLTISSPGHLKALGKYLDDGRALARGSQNVLDDAPGSWQREFAETREAYGHDKPSRAGSKSALVVHQVIGFNPDECSCNGGPISPEKAMEFAREWLSTRYGDFEAVYVLHLEHCKADGTDRLAVHAAINVSSLDGSGRRLWEGPAKQAKVARAKAIREMDARWGLRQMERGVRNSRVHAMQPSRTEKEMARRGAKADKTYIRERVGQRVREIEAEAPKGNRMRELSKRLEADGVRMTRSASGKQLQFRREGSAFKVNGNRLGRGFSPGGIAKGLGIRSAMALVHEIEQEMGR